jgi:undecaprenyl diphosphate synthase
MSEITSNTNLPRHVGIILDGNRRWAVERGLPHIEGHKEALKRIKEIIQYSADVGIEYMTLWLWSTKNWKRNQGFIDDIMLLFREHLSIKGLFDEAIASGAELHHLGQMDKFPQDIINNFQKLLLKSLARKNSILIWRLAMKDAMK